jgi:hydroxymethylpyrimidine pyrophosphatase-like HAD family hydrolase
MRTKSHRHLESHRPLVALAVDVDRTLMPMGRDPRRSATEALATARSFGLKVIVASGRQHPWLASLAARLRVVDAIVAENGAVVEAPIGARPRIQGRLTSTRVRRRLAHVSWPDLEFGDVVVSAPRSRQRAVANLLRGLEVDLVPNVDRIMVLPAGVSKASGVHRALRALDLGSRDFAAIGDGENDIPLLRAAALSGAVRNARPAVRASAQYVCRGSFGEGVNEFVRGPVAEYVLDRSSVVRAASGKATRGVD